jgi:hypothetical protein
MREIIFLKERTEIIEKCKKSLAEGCPIVLSRFVNGYTEYSFHPDVPRAGDWLFKNYGLAGIRSLNDGISAMERINKDNSNKYGISTSTIQITLEIN